MRARIGVRREDKSRWERRVPVIPEHAVKLREEHGVEVWLQPSEIRIFAEEEYNQAGVTVREDLSPCPVVFAVKEIPEDFFEPGKTYVFFSHTIKGQPYNMPMLKRMLELGCTLIDYEKVTDERGRRLIFFGRHAGLAGMIDTLWALGQRLSWDGISSPFAEIRQTYQYGSLAEAQKAVVGAGEKIAADGLPESITPLIIGVAGYGNVSRGVQEILSLLPTLEIGPGEVEAVTTSAGHSRNHVYKVVLKEEHTVEPISPADRFELQDFYDHPEKYRSQFEKYLLHLTVLVNCIYWEKKYPRLVTKACLKRLFDGDARPRLRVIGDISCDIEGAIECTLHCTEPDEPVFVYDPVVDRAIPGYEGQGPVVLAVDILPSELPRESSADFSRVLLDYIPAIAKADYSVKFEQLDLPPEIKRAVIAHRGELTPDYRYLKKFLQSS
jgi:saccharopine dehydrogenase (NAD+, L-lysine-forming)